MEVKKTISMGDMVESDEDMGMDAEDEVDMSILPNFRWFKAMSGIWTLMGKRGSIERKFVSMPYNMSVFEIL